MEILLRIKDKNDRARREFDWAATKRGDVIVVMPDGHLWGKGEIFNPDWRIVKLPGLPWEISFDWADPVLNPDNSISLCRKFRINLETEASRWLTDCLATNQVVTLYEHEYPLFFALKEARLSPKPEIICPQ